MTAALPYEQYDLKLAYQEMANSPCANGACKSISNNYMYLNTGTDWSEATQFLVQDLAAINSRSTRSG